MESQVLHKVKKLSDALKGNAGEPGDLTGVMRHIAQTAKNVFTADSCVIFAINPITNHFIGSLTVVGTLLKRDNLSYQEPRPEGIAPQVLRQGILLVEDLDATPQYHSIFTRSEGIRSFAGLALYTKRSQKPLGVLYLNFRQQQQFSSEELELFQFFADQASSILQETRLLWRYQEVARIGQEINHELETVEILFQKLQKYLPDILDTSCAFSLAVYQPQTSTLDVYLEEEGRSLFQWDRPMEGAYRHVIETQQVLFIKHLSKEAKHLPFKHSEISIETRPKKSLIFVPLVLRDIPLGVLSIQHAQSNAYNQEDLSILQLLAPHIALALHNMRLYNSLAQLNNTGQLLTQQLDSEQALQATVDKIRDVTKADLVVLYPYEPVLQRFVLPPITAGALLTTTIQYMSYSQPNDTLALMLQRKEPIYAKNGATFYTILHGNSYIMHESFGQREKVRSIAAIPLHVADELVGVLFVNFRQSQRFDATQKLFIDGLAHYAAVAIKNARAFSTLIQRRLRELEILQNIDRELSRNLELQPVLDTLLKLAHEQVPADGASILLHDARMQSLVTMATIGPQAEFHRAFTIPLQAARGITRWVLEQKKPARVDNVHLDPLWRDIYIAIVADTVSELDVPLLDGDEVIGVLNFESTRESAFRQEDEDFLLTLAGQALLAVKNAQAYEREKRLVAEGQVLNEISKEITSQLDPTRVFDLILENALALTHSTLGGLLLYDSDLNDLRTVAARGMTEVKKGVRLGLQQGIVGYVARNKQWVNADLSQPAWKEIYVEYVPGMYSELAVPMLAGNELRGVLYVESPTPNNFNESDERLLQGLADMAVVALQNAQAYEREKRLLVEAQVLNEISKEITSQLDLPHVFDLILENALELTHSTLGSLHLYDPDQNNLWIAAERGVSEGKKSQRIRVGQGVVGLVATDKKRLNVTDVFQLPWNKIFLDFFPGVRSEIAVPMLAGNELRGVLNVESPYPNNFNESDERLLQGLADMAVVALQNAQSYEREKRLVAEGQLLNEISKEIISQLDYVRVFDLILKKAVELTHATVGGLFLYDPDLNDLQMEAGQGQAEDKRGVRMDLHQGIIGYVARNKKMVNADLSQALWKEIYADLDPGNKMSSELVVPMLAGDKLRGVLNVESNIHRNFSERDERLLLGLADLAVVALQNAERYLQSKLETQRFEWLYQAAQELGKISELSQLEQTYDIILHIVEKYCNGQLSIRRYEDETQELVAIRTLHRQYSPPFPLLKLDEGVHGQVARERRTIVIYDTKNPPPGVVHAKQSDPTVRSLIITPLMFKERYYGNLGLSHKEVGHFGDRDVHFLEGLTHQLASTIYRLETAQERQEFKQRAVETEAMGSIGQIAFELTHRWGNDLGLVRSYVNDIRSELKTLDVNNEFIAEKLDHILQATGAVLNLSKELKQALVRTGGAIADEPMVIESRILLEEAEDVTSLSSNISLCREIDEDVAAVRVIHGLIVDILRNLITNAIDAMPEGGKITLKAYNAGRFVALEVTDTGVGIPPQSLSKIFDLFYSTKGSSGFGLWSARTNAYRNQGDLTVKSLEGLGTTFTLLLPRAED